MRKTIRLFLGCVLFLSIFSISACSNNPSGIDVMMDMQKAMKKVDSFHAKMNMDLEMSMVVDKSNLNMKMDMNADLDVNIKSNSSHVKMDMNADVLGQKQTTTMESYTVIQDDAIVTYSNDGTGTGWMQSSEESSIDDLTKVYEMDKDIVEKLNPKVVKSEKINGVDTYRVEMDINKSTFKDFSDILDDSSSMLDGLNSLDDFSFTYVINVNKENSRIAQMSIDLKDMESLLSTMFMGSELDGAEVKMDKAELSMDFTKFNKIDEISVPQEVIDGAQSSDLSIEGKQGDISTQTHAWETFKVLVEGNEITVGTTTLQSLLDMGYTIDNSYDDVVDKVDAYSSESISLIHGEHTLMVSVDNLDKKKKNINECVISYLAISSYDANEVIFPSNIKIGSTQEEVLNAYGEANTIYDEYLLSWDYEGADESIYSNLSFYFENGLVTDISLGVYR